MQLINYITYFKINIKIKLLLHILIEHKTHKLSTLIINYHNSVADTLFIKHSLKPFKTTLA